MSQNPLSVALVHLGCARNLVDSELILARLAEEGCTVSGTVEGADVAVLNTCSFIGPAREESEAALNELLEKKRRGELSAVCVAGCLVQRFSHQLEERYPEVDLFSEISDYRELAQAVRKLGTPEAGPRYLAAGGLREAVRDGSRLLATPGSYAYLRISHGCDHTCSFCAIPGIRGKHRSKRPADLLDEARELLDAGVHELVLVAEDSTAWGRDLGRVGGRQPELTDLVEELADLPGDFRLRVMYAYPNRFPWRLLPLLRDHPNVASYLDMPVQHIATPVLRAMRRAGSGEAVRAILDRLLAEVPGITLRTTLLVGFPGETEADAEALVDLVREYRLGRLGAFPYSPEEGTPAFDLEAAPVPEAETMRRMDAVFRVRDENLARSQGERVGEEVELLVDERYELEDGGAELVGRDERDAPEVDLLCRVAWTRAAGDVPEVGERVRVKAVGVDDDLNLTCEPAK